MIKHASVIGILIALLFFFTSSCSVYLYEDTRAHKKDNFYPPQYLMEKWKEEKKV